MDFQTILLLTLAALVALALVILAGAVLTVRSFTLLTDVIRFLGSLAGQLWRDRLQVPTSSSDGQGNGSSSVPTPASPTTPEPPAPILPGDGSMGTK